MNEDQLDPLLKQWRAPAAPESLERRVLEAYRRRRVLAGGVRVPIPVAAAALLALVLSFARPPSVPAPTITYQALRVEVPVVRERVVHREWPKPPARLVAGFGTAGFQPVTAFRPRIIRSGDAARE